MMVLHPRTSCGGMSSALLISALALPVSVIAFAVLYGNSDSFWSVLWLGAVLPAIWVAATVLSIRDSLKRRSWSQIAGVVALLSPTGFLFNTMVRPPFAFHHLFTFRPLDLHIPTILCVLLDDFM